MGSILSFAKKKPNTNTTDASLNGMTAEQKRQKGLGDPELISYRFPHILYFYPHPRSDPNYILLNPDQDKVLLNKMKMRVLAFVSFMFSLGILYVLYDIGILFPALNTMWFFFWRYLTIILIFVCFMIMLVIMRMFPFFGNKLKYYGWLTMYPLKDPTVKRQYDKFSIHFRWMVYWGNRIKTGILTLGILIFLFIIMLPAFGLMSILIGLMMGDATMFGVIPFGMAEYEITELGKKPLQKRLENATGITRAREITSRKISQLYEGVDAVGKKVSTYIPDTVKSDVSGLRQMVSTGH